MSYYYVYVILCENQCFYTGFTKNVESRVRLHTEGRGARYTRMHKPERLVYVEMLESKRDAMRREREIKKLNHEGKQRLVNSATEPPRLPPNHFPKEMCTGRRAI
jgi:putative endonuclease